MDFAVQDADMLGKLHHGFRCIVARIKLLTFELPRDAKIHVRINRATEGCSYYFVDHGSGTDLSFEDIDIVSLGIPEASPVWYTKHVLRSVIGLSWNPFRTIPFPSTRGWDQGISRHYMSCSCRSGYDARHDQQPDDIC
ncbi:hypothetical protein CERSUDRAFT_110638 [Gelatoporia subvermispora B]|uniref:Uncharacterized protein n=1 Tax=Ceriporiopsis subvermispora (strain B) TaxID=914234 RepID=M2PYW6_CERS8|nr:hypothetical protein CERSUDRAFT_110638 [Gelatoporia subvermispora B]